MATIKRDTAGWTVTTQGGASEVADFPEPFVIHQGLAWNEYIRWIDHTAQDVDCSGATATFIVKIHHGDTAATMSLSGGSGITLQNANPSIIIARSAEQTAALSFIYGVFGLKVVAGSQSIGLRGRIELRRGLV